MVPHGLHIGRGMSGVLSFFALASFCHLSSLPTSSMSLCFKENPVVSPKVGGLVGGWPDSPQFPGGTVNSFNLSTFTTCILFYNRTAIYSSSFPLPATYWPCFLSMTFNLKVQYPSPSFLDIACPYQYTVYFK